MKKLHFTPSERKMIRDWLNKDPNHGFDSGEPVLRFDNLHVELRRTTLYLPGGTWKVRVAYVGDEGFPVAMSSPIPMGQTSNKKIKGKSVDLLIIDDVPGKKASNFAEAADKAFKEFAEHIKSEMNKPSPWYNLAVGEKEVKNGPGYVTFHINTNLPTKGKLTDVEGT